MLFSSWLRSLPSLISHSSRRQRAMNRRMRQQPKRAALQSLGQRRAEQLEDRSLLSSITVTSLADNMDVDGVVTLREAIQAAETDMSVDGSTAGSGADTITFAPSLFTGGDQTISLSLFDTGLDATEFGATAFIISTDITIEGPTGDNGLTIERNSGAANFRLFHVQASGDLTLDSLTLSGGVAQGGNGGTSAKGAGGGAGMGGGHLFTRGSHCDEQHSEWECGGWRKRREPRIGNRRRRRWRRWKRQCCSEW